MKKLILTILFVTVVVLGCFAQISFTKAEADAIVRLLTYEENGEFFGNERKTIKGFWNVAYWCSCCDSLVRKQISIDTLYFDSITNDTLGQIILEGKYFEIQNQYPEDWEAKNYIQEIKLILNKTNIPYIFFIKQRYWYPIITELKMKSKICTDPWPYITPPPPKLIQPEITEVPDSDY